jgi:hypothetical protein
MTVEDWAGSGSHFQWLMSRPKSKKSFIERARLAPLRRSYPATAPLSGIQSNPSDRAASPPQTPRARHQAAALRGTLPPLRETTKASDNADFGAHSRSFRTCSPTLRVSCCHSRARLASGWLAGLYREGVEPSGSLRKVSDHMVIPLSCPPDATHVPYRSLVELRAAYTPDAARSVSGHPPSLSRRSGQPSVLRSSKQISTLQQWFAYARLSRPCLSGSCPDFSTDRIRRSRRQEPYPVLLRSCATVRQGRVDAA